MALINLQTNLKSLKFGKDRPGGGDSGQPYKTKDIGQSQGTTGGPDFLLRGGSLAPVRSIQDVSRLSKFFFDFKNPRGALFIAKQNVLSRQNVQTEVSSKMAKRLGISRTGYAGGALNQGVYLPTSTIAQAGVGFTGTHLNLFGIDPSDPMLKRGKNVNGLIPGLGLTMYGDYQAFLQREANVTGEKTVSKIKKVRNPAWPLRKKYPELWVETDGFGQGQEKKIEIVYEETLPSEFTNRLVQFWDEKQISEAPSSGGLFKDGPEVLYKYPGGPGSVLGIGKTTIRFASDNQGGILRTGINNSSYVSNQDWFLGTKERDKSKLQLKDEAYLGASTLFWADLSNNGKNQRIWTDEEKSIYSNYIIGANAPGGEYSNVSDQNNTGFTKNRANILKGFYDPLAGLSQRSIIAGPNNFTKFGYKATGLPTDYLTSTNYRVLAPMRGEFGFMDGASAAYGRAFVLSGSPNATDNVTGIDYSNNDFFEGWLPGGGVNNGPDGEGFLSHNVFKNTGFTFDQQMLMQQTSARLMANIKPSFVNEMYISDTLVDPITTGMNISSFAPDYTKMRKENRLSYGDPGINAKNRFDYGMEGDVDGTDDVYVKKALDKINASKIYENKTATHGRSSLFEGGKGEGRNDLAKFSIGIVQNNDSGKSWWMHFRAFIDSFSDNYTAEWKDIKYSGRSEKFFNYGGFDREISLAWTVVAQSKAELIPMYRKLNYLASSLAGSYSDGGFMRGNLYYLNVGGYLYKQLGVITGLTYDVPQEATWEIAIKQDGTFDNSVKELPHMIKITGVKFKPIHSFIPRRKGNPANQGDTPFIALSNGRNNNYL